MFKLLRKNQRRIAFFLAINLLIEVLSPALSYGLTSGPKNPEFTSFEPVATTDMVNVFSGDFTYNLPVVKIPGGPDGGDYALSLSYHSGEGVEEEASWVGYGWSLNPGAINRNTRGYPDEYYDNEVVHYNKTRPNWSMGFTQDLGIECTGVDVSLSSALSYRYNNYTGFSTTLGFGVGFKGMINVGLSTNAGETTVSGSVNPIALLRKALDAYKRTKNKEKTEENKDLIETAEASPAIENSSRCEMTEESYKRAKELLEQLAKNKRNSLRKSLQKGLNKIGPLSLGGSYGLLTYNDVGSPSMNNSYDGFSINLTFSSMYTPAAYPFGFEVGCHGFFSYQRNEASNIGQAFGYKYNENTPASTQNHFMDYTTEKASPYNKRDNFIGIPFNGADNFALTGEGLNGGFRGWQERVGHYYPNWCKGGMTIVQMGMETALGEDLGVGFDAGVGRQEFEVKDWAINGEDNAAQFNSGTPVSKYRFSNDLGGKVNYNFSNNTATERFIVKNDNSVEIPGARKYKLLNPGSTSYNSSGYSLNPNDYSESSHIETHTLEDITNKASSTWALKSNTFNKNSNTGAFANHIGINNLITTSTQLYEKSVAEYMITNPEGVSYVYGLPVFSKDETAVSVGIRDDINGSFAGCSSPTPLSSTSPATIYQEYLAKTVSAIPGENNYSVLTDNKIIVGETKVVPYPTSYLLTQIFTPDYIDITDDGPTNDDYGGWTRFEYKQLYGGTGTWYNWRSPYSGLLFQKNQMSEFRDDMGTIAKGKKEMYNLKVIETKTHYAFFITSKTSSSDFSTYYPSGVPAWLVTAATDNRKDGLDAAGVASDNFAAQGTNKIAKLDKIVLVSKERMDQALQIVHFDYDYSLCRNVPNNVNVTNWPSPISSPTTYNNSGKLTLKKVWFEYEGVTNARISPYEFKYEYKTVYPSEVATRYPDVANFAAAIPIAAQNPDYIPGSFDMWGNHQYNGITRRILDNPWLYQGNIPLPTSSSYAGYAFDPAAWQLKQIILPSGGQIHIQYEQDDYMTVQDKNAMAMVSLKATGNTDGPAGSSNVYILNLADIGLDWTNTSDQPIIQSIKDQILSEYKNKEDKKMYFKFLYGLKNGVVGTLNDCHSEYIKGYAFVNDVTLNTTNGDIKISFGHSGKKDAPRNECLEYVRKNKVGKLDGATCSNMFTPLDDALSYLSYLNISTSSSSAWNSFSSITGTNFCYIRGQVKDIFENANFNAGSFIEPLTLAQIGDLNPSFSYIKIPMMKAKRGGGLRVKRLLMYDDGISTETGQAVVYGNEYIYKTENGESSGVATNEPPAGREENALVGFLPRQKQTWFEKITQGEDHKEAEGPIGESLLPSPSVGYSRVGVINLHTGNTGTGYTVHEFYTAKDYPFDRYYNLNQAPNFDVGGASVEYTNLQEGQGKDFMIFPAGVFNYKRNASWVAQGFKFVINNMHGQPKSVSTFGGGVHVPGTGGNPGHYDLNGPISSSQVYHYFEPGEKVKMLEYSRTGSGSYSTYMDTPGKEMDLSMEMQKVQDLTIDISLELDISIGLITYPPVYLTAMPSLDYNDLEVNTHAMTKVLRYPAILKSTESFMDGARTITENLAFDRNTGDVVVTKTYDEYDGLLNDATATTTKHNGEMYAYSFPAAWYYGSMGPKAVSGTNQNSLKAKALNIATYGANGAFNSSNWPLSATNGPKNVTSAGFNTYSTTCFPTGVTSATDPNLYAMLADYNPSSTIVPSLNSKWFTKNTYLYKNETGVKSSHPTVSLPGNRNYSGGVFDIPFAEMPVQSDWANGQLPSTSTYANWVKSNSVKLHDVNGLALMDVNPLNIYSSARYAYDYKLPVAIAKNAQYSNILFYNFEDGNDYISSWSSNLSAVNPHSGNKALSFNPVASTSGSSSYINLDGSSSTPNKSSSLIVTQHVKDKGIQVKYWLKTNKFSIAGAPRIKFSTSSSPTSSPFTCNKVAQTGEWSLYEAQLPAGVFSSTSVGNDLNLFLFYDLSSGENLYVDDIRVQPLDAVMTCYVYDKPSKRLLAQFDDQHFGLYYQYNNEGQLVRKLAETEKGLVTLAETQYNTPKKNR